MNMTIKDAFRKSVETMIDWIAREVNMNKTYVIFRTYSPVHFRFALTFKQTYLCLYLCLLKLCLSIIF